MGISLMVFLMICLGAYTRLLKMGHSITGMHAIGLKGHYDAFKVMRVGLKGLIDFGLGIC